VREQREKLQNYSKFVKEMYQPKVSPKKRFELEQLKGKLHTHAKKVDEDEFEVDQYGNPIKRKKKGFNEKPWRDAVARSSSIPDHKHSRSEVHQGVSPSHRVIGYEDSQGHSERKSVGSKSYSLNPEAKSKIVKVRPTHSHIGHGKENVGIIKTIDSEKPFGSKNERYLEHHRNSQKEYPAISSDASP
jgi:hypothetical protein